MNTATLYTTKSRIERIEEERQRLKDRIARCEFLIKALRSKAVEDGMAMWTPGNARELAPNKSWWIEHEGIDRWNEVKSSSNPSPVFTWLIS